MRPDETPIPAHDPRGTVSPPQRDHIASHQAVVTMTREQINQIYQQQAQSEPAASQSTQASTHTTASTLSDEQTSPYHHTHGEQHTIKSSDWQHYHSAWQSYYQKYYERYYIGEVSKTNQAYQAHAAKLQETMKSQFATQPGASDEPEDISKDEAMYDLRAQLLDKVKTNAKKVRKSRHFIPAIAAAIVVTLFAFLQYNSVIIAYAVGYVSPGSIQPDNIIVDPNLSLKVGPEPLLIIPKINVQISVDYNAKTDYNSQMASMQNNVAYFGIPGASSRPGEYGNTPMAGHSSNDFTASGNAKFIFARLDQLQAGDTFYLNYGGTRYTYNITKTLVVAPNDVKALQIGTDKPYATLITCTPLGTATNRLLVIGEQISPSPATATQPATSGGNSADIEMAGKSPTLLERAFGAQ